MKWLAVSFSDGNLSFTRSLMATQHGGMADAFTRTPESQDWQ